MTIIILTSESFPNEVVISNDIDKSNNELFICTPNIILSFG